MQPACLFIPRNACTLLACLCLWLSQQAQACLLCASLPLFHCALAACLYLSLLLCSRKIILLHGHAVKVL